MALLPILTYPDDRLKQVSMPVQNIDEQLRHFIHDLEETMRNGPGGVGIAAPQVARFDR
ncbi:MAG: peptide deformylase, partial [Thioalkalispiraceae bacterium]